MEVEKVLAQLVRIGTVTDVDNAKRKARVKFQDEELPSGWLYVLAARPYIPDYETDPQRTEFEAGGSGGSAFENHKHDLVIKPSAASLLMLLLLASTTTPQKRGTTRSIG